MIHNEDSNLFRILDANGNRAAEGLRTLEDVARMHSECGSAARLIKELRHQLGELIQKFNRVRRLQARFTETDAGTEITASGESSRSDLASLVPAACERTTQALRQLEECGKLIAPDLAERLKQLRYLAYDRLAQVELWLIHQAWDPATANIYLLIDCSLPLDRFTAYISELAEAGVDVFQLRDKAADGAKLVQYARAAKSISSSPRLVINDRVDIALAVSADGVHVGQDDMAIDDVRAVAGRKLAVGVSTHDMVQARLACEAGADYIGCGPTFPSGTKDFDEFPGPAFLSKVVQQLDTPAFAIGGIDRDNLSAVVDAGFRRVAISGAIHNSDSPTDAVHAFKQGLLQAH